MLNTVPASDIADMSSIRYIVWCKHDTTLKEIM